MKIRRSTLATPLCLIVNLALAYVAYAVCRLAFLAENWNTFATSLTWPKFWEMVGGGLRFDTSAILYTNVPYILLMLIPLHLKETDIWQRVARWVYIVLNGFCVVANLADCVYFQYTGRRTTVTVFSEFAAEGNIGSVVGVELLRHWYLVAVAAVVIGGLWLLMAVPRGERPAWVRKPLRLRPALAYYALHTACLLVAVPLCVIGMRGGATTAVRPITISNANQYVDRPQEAAIVLNTPFSLIRTIDKEVFVVPDYFDPATLEAIYSPLHVPADSLVERRKNVVVLIVESFGREYIGALNRTLDGGTYRGYTPFIDELCDSSATWDYSFCNGRKSIDGMPSILSSIPMFVEPFFLTPSSLNDVSGIAGELFHKGYHSAFFHGAENGSMGFQAFARTTGFDEYYGRTEYDADPRFNGDADFDGMWAIWDEPFLQFYALKMSEMPEPFVTSVFTATSHHPYVVPKEYRDTFPEEGNNVIHKCIRYTDHALRRFFETARKQPWFDHTLFVLTSDHTNIPDHDFFRNDIGSFCSPIIIYDPSGDIAPGRRHAIAQQIDIMPTVLGHLGYDRPYVAFGIDLFATPDEETWAVNYNNGIYQYVKGDCLLQFDGQATRAVYNIRTDSLLQRNIVGNAPQQPAMERELKAIIQQYMTRMTENRLVAD